MSQLPILIEECYQVFCKYKLREKIDSCPHCELDAEERRLHERKLEDLTWDHFGVYLYKAITTFGDEEDFKHFLPRIMELFLTDYEHAAVDTGILFSKLKLAGWTQWPADEFEIVRNILETWFSELQNTADPDSAWIWEDVLQDIEAYDFEVPERNTGVED